MLVNTTLLLLKHKTINLSDFNEVHKFYLKENVNYDPLSLHQAFKDMIKVNIHNDRHSYRGFFTDHDSDQNILKFSQYNFPFNSLSGSNRWKARTVLFFHEKFYESFSAVDNDSFNGSVMIENEKYYYFYNSANRVPLKVSFEAKKLQVKIPNVVKVLTKDIKPILTQEGYSNQIAIFSLNTSDSGKYFHQSFTSPTHFPFDFICQRYLEIELVDENNERLHLTEGLPSIVKLHASPEEKMNQIHLRVNSRNTLSFTKNSPSDFSVKLAKSLSSTNEWECAVSSIIIRNDFEISEDLDLSFETTNLDTSMKYKTVRFEVPKKTKDTKGILDYFIKSLNNVVTVKITSDDNRLTLKFKKNLKLTISNYLARLLGFSQISESVTLNKTRNQVYKLPFAIQDIPLYPSNVLLNANFVDYCILGHSMGRILKVVPLKKSSLGTYQFIEFDVLEFVPVVYSEVQNLHFTLISHTGSLIKFRNDDFSELYLNLVFRKRA